MTDTPVYKTTVRRKAGRIGELHLQRNGTALPPLSTPILYPVLSFMTSTSTNGGRDMEISAERCYETRRANPFTGIAFPRF